MGRKNVYAAEDSSEGFHSLAKRGAANGNTCMPTVMTRYDMVLLMSLMWTSVRAAGRTRRSR